MGLPAPCGVQFVADNIHITYHAVQRWIERVEAVSFDEAVVAILRHTPAILTAIEMGCCCVKLGCGARLVLDGARVVTVYPRQPKSGSLQNGRRIPFSASRWRPRALRSNGGNHGEVD